MIHLFLKRNIILLFFAVLGASVLADSDVRNFERFTGIALNERGEKAYLEEHEIEFRGGKVFKSKTSYLDSKTLTPIAELVSDYSQNHLIPDHYFKDFRNQDQDIVRLEGNVVKMTTIRGGKKEAGEIQYEPTLLGCQGFHYFIQEQLGKLVNEKEVVMKLIVPIKKDAYEFKQTFKKVSDSRAKVWVRANNFFLRLFAPNMEIEYDLGSKRILGYKGASNISDLQGHLMNVVIQYDYNKARF